MKYVEEWKLEEIERTKEYYRDLLNDYNEILEETKLSCNYWNNRSYFIENGMTEEECLNEHKRLYKIRSEFEKNSSFKTMSKFIVRDKEKCGYEIIGVSKNGYEIQGYKCAYKMNETLMNEVIVKLVNKHFEGLQEKVENKIGKIIEIESLGGYDYKFIGEQGNCSVEVILAGGYNIQRLHTRWIIKK